MNKFGCPQACEHPNQFIQIIVGYSTNTRWLSPPKISYFLQQGLPSAPLAHAFFGATPGAAMGAEAFAEALAAASPCPPHLCSAEAPEQAAFGATVAGADTEADAAEPSFLQQAFVGATAEAGAT